MKRKLDDESLDNVTGGLVPRTEINPSMDDDDNNSTNPLDSTNQKNIEGKYK